MTKKNVTNLGRSMAILLLGAIVIAVAVLTYSIIPTLIDKNTRPHWAEMTLMYAEFTGTTNATKDLIAITIKNNRSTPLAIEQVSVKDPADKYWAQKYTSENNIPPKTLFVLAFGDKEQPNGFEWKNSTLYTLEITIDNGSTYSGLFSSPR